MFKKIIDGFKNFFKGIKSKVKTLTKDFGKVWEWNKKMWKDFGSHIKNGIKNKINTINRADTTLALLNALDKTESFFERLGERIGLTGNSKSREDILAGLRRLLEQNEVELAQIREMKEIQKKQIEEELNVLREEQIRFSRYSKETLDLLSHEMKANFVKNEERIMLLTEKLNKLNKNTPREQELIINIQKLKIAIRENEVVEYDEY